MKVCCKKDLRWEGITIFKMNQWYDAFDSGKYMEVYINDKQKYLFTLEEEDGVYYWIEFFYTISDKRDEYLKKLGL